MLTPFTIKDTPDRISINDHQLEKYLRELAAEHARGERPMFCRVFALAMANSFPPEWLDEIMSYLVYYSDLQIDNSSQKVVSPGLAEKLSGEDLDMT